MFLSLGEQTLPLDILNGFLGTKWTAKEVLKKGDCPVYGIENESGKDFVCKVICVSLDGAKADKMRSEGYTTAQIEQINERLKAGAASEALVMSRASSCRNTVKMRDYGHFEYGDKEYFYIITDRYDVVPRSISDEKEVIRLGMDICTAIDDLNKIDIVHRDIKPENCYYDGACYRLGDFGTSRLMGGSIYATVTGTPTYMAPEIIRFYGKNIDCVYDKRVDIYSLGLTMYTMLNNGLLPFMESSGANEAHEIKRAVKRRMEDDNIPKAENAGEGVMRIIRKACSVDPAKRYPNAEKMKEALYDLYEIIGSVK